MKNKKFQVYLIKKGKNDAALDSLKKLRGAAYNSEAELQELKEQLEKSEQEKAIYNCY